MEQKSIIKNYENMQKELIDEFIDALLTQSSDLSRISKEDYEKALKLFVETKLILFEDNNEDFNIRNLKGKNLLDENEEEEEEEDELENLIIESGNRFVEKVSDFFNDFLE